MYLRNPLEMGDPNVLVCFADRFSPPVLKITWLKNGQPVSEGVEETAFFPSVDNTFRKFSYLPLVPEDGDIYTCQVEHLGLDRISPTLSCPQPLLTSERGGEGLTQGFRGLICGMAPFMP
uniref:Ig-like domain-containing protein n=1 Tax=Salvator merianae TaxID=96440 RepID=A0A8D0BMV3_SALMN